MFTIKSSQEQSMEDRNYGEYLRGFSEYLKTSYPDLDEWDDAERIEMVDEWHQTAEKLKMEDYSRINTWITCCFMFGEDQLLPDRKLVELFQHATYDPEGMIKYVIRHQKMKEYGQA